ncbi:hypothetical protein OSB04_000553 [Centaurea solstitialis]|uniref:Uncharacterized protein n=1 Tax=Centaurea solstitialis TaxID=347529 RepID=A0AA38WKM7_9ASTR|nr:hypothetical protein OSB04_000553 [Centaurea solstitialis]
MWEAIPLLSSSQMALKKSEFCTPIWMQVQQFKKVAHGGSHATFIQHLAIPFGPLVCQRDHTAACYKLKGDVNLDFRPLKKQMTPKLSQVKGHVRHIQSDLRRKKEYLSIDVSFLKKQKKSC